jgi:translocation and assembly module TamB
LAAARVDRRTSSVDATVRADLTGVWVADTSVGRASILGTAAGDLRAPRLNLRAQLKGVERSGLKLEQLTLDAAGTPSRTNVRVSARETKGRTIAARADVDLTRQSAKNLDLALKNGGVELHAKAKSLALRDRGVIVDGLLIEGAGELELSIETRPGSIAIKGKGQNVELEKVARLLQIDQRVSRGRATFDVDLKIAGSQISGRANVRVDGAMIAGIGPLDAKLDAIADDGKIDGDAAIDLEPTGDLRVRAVDLEFGGEGPSLEGLKQASGQLELQTRVDLAQLPRSLLELLPFDRTSGEVRLTADALRVEPGAPANLRVYLDTKKLQLLAASSPAKIEDRAEAIRRKPRRLAGLDFNAELRVIGATRQSSLLARVYDKKGPLVDLQAVTPLTVEDALAGELVARIWQRPLLARAVIPRRKLSELPAIVRPTALAGELSLEAEAAGTLAEPNLALDFRVDQLRSKDPNRRFSMDFRTQARYVARHTEVVVDASNRGQPLAHVRAWADGSVHDIARGQGFVASGRAMFRGLPLALVPGLRERQVRGKLFGDVMLTDLGKNAKAQADLATKELKFGALTVQGASLKLRAEDGRLSAQAAVDHSGGYARAKLLAGIKWGQRLVLEVDNGRPLDAELQAKNFRAAVLLPFVHETFSELDGNLDANLKVTAAGGQTQVLGEANLEDGALQIPSIGQQFHDVTAGVRAEPGGILKIENVSARGLTGRLRAAASARLQGLSLYAADAKVRIDRREQLPVTVEGVTLGEAWGDADLSLRTFPEKNTNRVAIKVPRFHLELTEVERSELQSLDDAERVRIGVRLEQGKFRRLPLQPLEEPAEGGSTLLLDIDLGNDVWIRQGSTVRVKLGGRLTLELKDRLLARGKIDLSKGVIDVQGKRFEVERGVVSFQDDDPSNPLIVATARWESPEGYRVYADYYGRAKNGKLTLRSEPPLAQDEILSLLLFGTPDGSFGSDTGEGNQAAMAVGVAGGAATKGLNRALGDLTSLDVSTRIDTSYGDPRPEVVVQLTRRLSAELSYAVGEPAPGKSPDRTFLTLDLRLGSRWSLATTFGDRGASMLDMLWRYRY